MILMMILKHLLVNEGDYVRNLGATTKDQKTHRSVTSLGGEITNNLDFLSCRLKMSFLILRMPLYYKYTYRYMCVCIYLHVYVNVHIYTHTYMPCQGHCCVSIISPLF